jgi:hypothetical protein
VSALEGRIHLPCPPRGEGERPLAEGAGLVSREEGIEFGPKAASIPLLTLDTVPRDEL